MKPQREPLGLVNAWNWARESKPEEGGPRPGVNEGLRWVESYAHLVGLAEGLEQTRLVCVGDRESDLMALFEQGQRSQWLVDVLVRARQHPVVPGSHQAGKLWAGVMGSPVLGSASLSKQAPRRRSPSK